MSYKALIYLNNTITTDINLQLIAKKHYYIPNTTDNNNYFDGKTVEFNSIVNFMGPLDANLKWEVEIINERSYKFYIYIIDKNIKYYLCYNKDKYYIHRSDNNKRVKLQMII